VSLKGKCALGPFLSILVIKCQHKWFKYETMPNGGRSANQHKGMILDLVHWFLCTVGPMLRRRRSSRKKQPSAEAVCVRWPKVPLHEASVSQTDLKIE
jgi:hypothetical protein